MAFHPRAEKTTVSGTLCWFGNMNIVNMTFKAAGFVTAFYIRLYAYNRK